MKKIYILILSLIVIQAQENSNQFRNMSIEELMNIAVVTASKNEEALFDAPGIISIITQDEINNFAADNLGDVLNKAAGSIFLSANVFTENIISFRGQTTTPYNNHVLFLINGRPVRDPITGGLNNALLTSFPLNIIKKIEIIRGPGSVLYGSCAYSGVINIITEDVLHNAALFSFDINGGSFSSFNQSFKALVRTDDIEIIAGLHHLKEDGPEFEFVDYLDKYNVENFSKESWSAFTNIKLGKLILNAAYIDYQPYALAGEDNNWDLTSDPFDNNNHKHFFLDAGYNWFLSDKLDLELNLTYNKREWFTNGGEKQTGTSLTPEILLDYRFNKNGNLIIGGTYSFDDYYGELLIDDNIRYASIYSQFDYRFSEYIKFICGFQYNRIENIGGNLSPRVGMIFNFNNNFGIKALYSQAYRKGYPLETSFDIPVFRGNLKLQPELIDTYEAQLFYQKNNSYNSLTFYYSNMSDIIFRKLFGNPAVSGSDWYLQYVNQGEHQFYGIEYEGKVEVNKNLTISGSAVYQTNERDDGVEDATLHPNLYVKLGFIYKTDTYNIGVFNSYFGDPTEVYTINSSVKNINKKPEAFSLLSAKLDVNITNLFKLNSINEYRFYISVKNIFGTDVRYPEYTTRGVNSLLPLYSGQKIKAGIKINLN